MNLKTYSTSYLLIKVIQKYRCSIRKHIFIKKMTYELTSPRQDVKRYPSGVRLNNRKFFFRAPGPRTKYFERFFTVQ